MDFTPRWKPTAEWHAAHRWVYKHYGKADHCTNGHVANAYEWSNNSHKYLRDISDWEQLCRSCHRRKDMTPKIALRISKSKTGVPNILKRRPIKQLDLQGNLVAVFGCLQEASDRTGILKTSINNNIRNRSKTAGGFIWTTLASTLH